MKSRKKIISNNDEKDENIEDYFVEVEKEIEYEIINENLSNSEKETSDNKPNNINFTILSNNDSNNYKVFLNENNSCSFDSFLIFYL